ncbi:uncharacterized protein LOC128783075 isoform X1 [Vidua chalybeata]|uniref:uncharacterized protein LOC128783075 isoform X1 n=1 Tax=Vidua chalybeata TaxID=81927 RepID=UPI0023A8F430|nr:uncharacterized protein LOC128783075 isoform X1 [Vidua chalybeata]
MVVQDPRPKPSISINNLNEEIKKDDFGRFGVAQSPRAGPGLRHLQGDEQRHQRPALHAGLPLLRPTRAQSFPCYDKPMVREKCWGKILEFWEKVLRKRTISNQESPKNPIRNP